MHWTRNGCQHVGVTKITRPVRLLYVKLWQMSPAATEARTITPGGRDGLSLVPAHRVAASPEPRLDDRLRRAA